MGVPRELRLGRRAGGCLSFAGGPAPPAGGSEAESLRCGEGEVGARLLGRQHLNLTFLDGAGTLGNVAGTLGSVLFAASPKWLRLHPGAGRCSTGFWVRLQPGSTSCEGILVPHPVPNPTRRGPSTCRLPVSSGPSHPCPCIGPSVARRSVSPAYLSGRSAPAPARLPQHRWRGCFYRRA